MMKEQMETYKKDLLSILGAQPDVDDNLLLEMNSGLLSILLADHSSKSNILWMTDNYIKHGLGYEEESEITLPLITGRKHNIIKPRVNKSKNEQNSRIRTKAEVFTPSWVCNQQNNLVDHSWFGRPDVFNTERDKAWTSTERKIVFPADKTWQDYVLSLRLEISCGEAPYLASRYDTTTGEMIPLQNRVGLLDRKLRIVTENTLNDSEWVKWAKKAVQSVYGFEWQGDSLLLARENILLTFIDYYRERFSGQVPSIELMKEISEIISWNLWQMDGLKFVVPKSCHTEIVVEKDFFEDRITHTPCEGCVTGDIKKHNGIYCMIRDWAKDVVFPAVSMLKG